VVSRRQVTGAEVTQQVGSWLAAQHPWLTDGWAIFQLGETITISAIVGDG